MNKDMLPPMDSLSPERRVLLQRMLSEKRSNATKKSVIPRLETQETFPLSFSQERLWFLAHLEPDSAAYNEAGVLLLQGKLDRTCLRTCCNVLIARHESLRTTFEFVAGQIRQKIVAPSSIALPVIDLQALSPERRTLEVQKLATAEAWRPFEVEQGPHLRIHLLQMASEEYILLITMHHIISDGWSVNILTQELVDLYTHIPDMHEYALPQLPIQYKDFAHWQRTSFSAGIFDQQVAYWKDQLHKPLPITALPADYPVASSGSIRGECQEVSIAQNLAREIYDLGKRYKVTPFIVLLAAFGTLIARLTHQQDLLIGSPIAGRTQVETEHIIGCFINTLTLRIDTSGDPSFEELLKRVYKMNVDAYEAQEVPFEKIIQEIQVERNNLHNPLFSILFNFNNTPNVTLELPGMRISKVDLAQPGAKFPLSVAINEQEQTFRIRYIYQADLFTSEHMAMLLEQYVDLLRQCISEPEKAISAYSLVTSSALALLPDPTTTIVESSYPCLPQLVLAQARQYPTQVALCQGEISWTYQDVVRHAASVTRMVRLHGVGKGDVIAVYGPSCPAFVSCCLAVLLSGGVLLLVDPDLVRSRQQQMLQEARATCLLYIETPEVDRAYLQELTSSPTLPVSPLVPARQEAELEDVEHQTALQGNDPAYIFFTSGTTGVPKGILGSHKGLSHFLTWQRETFQIEPEDRCAQLIRLSFDAVLRDMFLPLVSGATLCIPARPHELSAEYILPWLDQQRITLLHTIPSIVQLWIQHSPPQVTLSHLRLLFWSGEPMTDVLVQKWRRAFPAAGEIINFYGPTETTFIKSYYCVPREEQLLLPVQPVGRPLPETQMLVCTAQNTLCGIGEIGEIVIRTPFRTLGYINQRAEPESRFRINPFTRSEHDIVYYTGDYGRYRFDGGLDILGRLDQQVKIHGVRIELGEIAAVLARYEGVSACEVVAFKGEDQDYTLVAYIVSTSDESEEALATVLRKYLSTHLPSVMVPAFFRFLPAFPLTANGKLDRSALPRPDLTSRQVTTAIVAPRTASERWIVACWCDILKRDSISVEENFFTLGGHSLLAMEVIARLRTHFHIELPLRMLFEHPTIADLAMVCEQAQDVSPAQDNLLPQAQLHPEQLYQSFELTDVQQAYVVGRNSSLELGNVSTHNYSEFQFPLLDVEMLQTAVRKLIQRHSMLRAIVTVEGQYILKEPPAYTIRVHDQRNASAEVMRSHLEAVRQQLSHQIHPLDHWPLFELQVTQCSDATSLVHISLDSIICDAWSRRILGKELLALYENPEVRLPDLAISFRDYVHTEQALRATPLYQRARAYWLERLKDLPAAPELPQSVAIGSLHTPHFTRLNGLLEPDVWQRLKKRFAASHLTPSGFICAAYADILALWSKSSRFTLNMTLFNRLPVHAQINQVVGDFTSLVLLEVNSLQATFQERAAAVQKQLFDDLDHQYFGGIQVLRELNRLREGVHQAAMPIVLTSTLIDDNHSVDKPLATWHDNFHYGITQTPQVLLDHAVSEQNGALVFRWDYVAEAFPLDMIEDMFAAYQYLLHTLANEQSDAAWHLQGRAFLLPTWQRELYEQVNATQATISSDLLFSGFLRQAAAHPEALAVVAGAQRLCYGQLALAARQLAVDLVAAGVVPGDTVAVMMEKGWQQVLAALAISMAGAAYVPIDPSLPLLRRQFLLEHGRISVTLTRPDLLERLELPASMCSISISEQSLQPRESDHPLVLPVVSPDALAYVIYTSGSTGEPKGVMLNHRSVCNTLEDINARFSVSSQDCVLGLSSLSFDLSVYDIFGTLAAGATLILPEEQARRDPGRWLQLVRREGVTIWNSVPALLEMWLEYMDTVTEELVPDLRLVMLSGDWIALSLPQRLWDRCPQSQLISLGGATEAAIWSIYYPVVQVAEHWKSIPYGNPLRNQSWQILHEAMEPCPVWVPGQLYIGDEGLALGYWRDEQKTTASFVKDPRTAKRLYRTGDMGRYMPDGTIEFLGREDLQVKVQGHRIELGEIETVLERHAGVKQAIVLIKGARLGSKRLVAYLILNAGQATLSRELLSDYLRQYLPEYMVPGSWLFLTDLPLTANGKVDRNALLTLEDQVQKNTTTTLALPHTFTEAQVLIAYQKILKTSPPGIHENFFGLGGDSLSAIQMTSYLSNVLNVNISLRGLFEHPIVQEFARFIDTLRSNGDSSTPIPSIDRSKELPISSTQERIWFLCQLEPDSSFYNLPTAVKLTGPLHLDTLQRSIREIIMRHETLRTIFQSRRGKAHLIIQPEAIFTLTPIDLCHLPSDQKQQEISRLLQQEANQPFDLHQDTLLRIRLLRTDDTVYILMVTMHHIIADARSMELFVRELMALYEAFRAQLPAPLPPPGHQFIDFVGWQKSQLENAQFQEQMHYWRHQLGLMPLQQELRTDYRPVELARSWRGGRKPVSLTKDQFDRLRTFCQRAGVTPFIALLTAYQVAISFHTTGKYVPVNVSVANRQRSETEEMIGLFLNTLIMNVDLSGNPTLQDLVQRVRATTLEGYRYQDLPFEHIVKDLQPRRSLNYAPFSRVAFGLHNTLLGERRLQDIVITPLETYRAMSKFDLELQLTNETDGLIGSFEYNATLFIGTTIETMIERFHALVTAFSERPEERLETFKRQLLTQQPHIKEKTMQNELNKPAPKKSRFASATPRAVNLAEMQLVKTHSLSPAQPMPLVIEPAHNGINVLDWLAHEKDFVEAQLLQYGALLLRGFRIGDVTRFEQLMKTLTPELLEYKERSTPRKQVNGNVYTSTEYPAYQWIPQHNENSYAHTWPLKIGFWCAQAATAGGETPITDSRLIYKALPEELKKPFLAKQVLYVRNYSNALDLSWQEGFQTSDRAEVERYCRSHQIEFEWCSADHLRTRQLRQAMAHHPRTGEPVWFNQAHLFHVAGLASSVRDALLAVVAEEDLPRMAYYGDGTRIDDDVIHAINDIYQKHSIFFPWQANDMMLVDNMLVAHGRAPFEGTRKILVAMAESYQAAN